MSRVTKSSASSLDNLKKLSSRGLIVGVLGTVGGGLIVAFGVYMLWLVCGKGSSPLGILALYGMVLLLVGGEPIALGITALVPSILCRVALRRSSTRLLSVVRTISIVELVLVVLGCIALVMYFIATGSDISSSITCVIILYIVLGVPLSIFPLLYVYRITNVLQKLTDIDN
jgi:hypothetical protein